MLLQHPSIVVPNDVRVVPAIVAELELSVIEVRVLLADLVEGVDATFPTTSPQPSPMISFTRSSDYCGSGTVAGLPVSAIPTTRTFAGSVVLALRDTA